MLADMVHPRDRQAGLHLPANNAVDEADDGICVVLWDEGMSQFRNSNVCLTITAEEVQMELRERGDVALVVDSNGMALVLVKNTKAFNTEIGIAQLCDAFDDEEWRGIQ